MTAFKVTKCLADIGRIIVVSCSAGADHILTKHRGAPGAVTLRHVYRVISPFRNFCDGVDTIPDAASRTTVSLAQLTHVSALPTKTVRADLSTYSSAPNTRIPPCTRACHKLRTSLQA